jgi:acyl carrier protein phosphodiesterase
MNWLAHLYLSEPSSAFRIGNLLPDLVTPAEWRSLPPEFVRGAECHCRIDAFTDDHPIVRQSRGRIKPALRRYSGIVVDVFYDHFLSVSWARYSRTPLADFAAMVYDGFEEHRDVLPSSAIPHLKRIREANLLCCYGNVSDLHEVLRRISGRLSKSVPLADAVADLEIHYSAFQADFNEFFAALESHVGGGRLPRDRPGRNPIRAS